MSLSLEEKAHSLRKKVGESDFDDLKPAQDDSNVIHLQDDDDMQSTGSRRSSTLSSESLTLTDHDHPNSITVESLGLDIPSSYKVETVEFPSCPEEMKQGGVAMPIEPGRRASEDEEDHSIYQAQLLSNCQDVRLIKGARNFPREANRRKVIPVALDILDGSEGDLKTETLSNVEENCVSPESLDYSDLDDFLDSDELEESKMSRIAENDFDLIPELTASEEMQECRSWCTFSLAGVDREIDLRVLEPYKRVVSHGGYLSHGSRNAIIVFSACFLPDRSRLDYDYVMNNLFMYVISTLDQLVTDDYVLVYLHDATSRSAMPKFSWLKQCYQMIDRKLRKNLKGLYLVHPTFWLKTLAVMTRPFISSKFSKKLFFIYSLSELMRRVPLERASIPDKVVQYDFATFGNSSLFAS